MKDFRWIIRENIPCWYELAWDKKKPAIILRAHQDFIEAITPIPREAHLIKWLTEKFKFQEFNGDLKGNFGFNGSVLQKPNKVKNGFLEYIITIPKIKVETGNHCEDCNGSGRDFFAQTYGENDRKCPYCNGSGKEHIYNWHLAYAVSASLNVFFSISRYPERETSAPFSQLMLLDTITDTDMHGGSLGGEFSIPLTQWLASIYKDANTPVPEISQAMKIAYKHMFNGLRSFEKYDFNASVRTNRGGLVSNCPGNACGIHPEDWNMDKKRGYKFSCHNVDTPVQQITLLAGLAALHDRARKEMSE
jgi:hypothetical protein